MGREERRKKAKQDKKSNDKKVEAMRWVSSLPPAKAELIQSYAKMIADRDNKYFIEALDRCYTAAMGIEFEDLQYDQLQGVMEQFALLIEQDARKMRKLQDNSGGSIEMATKKVNDQAPAVEARVRELLAEGKKQKQIIETLTVEFNSLSKAMLTNAFKKTKQMINQEEVGEVIAAGEKVRDIVKSLGDPEVDTKKAVEYILGTDKDDDKDYLPAEEITVTELDEEIKTITIDEVKKMEIVNGEFKRPEAEYNFEILKEVRIMDLKGKHSTYHIEKNVVEVDGDLAFSNEDEVKEWASDERAKILRLLRDVNDRELETLKVFERFM